MQTPKPSDEELEMVVRRARHDMRSRLHAITMLGAALEEDLRPRLEPLHAQLLEQVVAAGRRLSLQSEGLFTWLRTLDAELRPERVRLSELVADAAATAVLPEPERDGDAVWVGDRLGLSRLLAAIFANSALFVAPGETPRVRVRVGETVIVDDAGIGVPPERWEEVFEPFRRLHPFEEYPGVGMGLTLARRLAAMHGGVVRLVEPALGGTSVEIAGIELIRDP